MTVAEEQEMPRTLAEIDREAVRTLKALRSTDDREQRTTLLRRCAALIVDSREHFLDEAGNPDWSGRTYAYRDHLREVFAKAGYSAEEKSNTQAAIRYHVSSLIRERLTPDELEALGLIEHSSADKAAASRAARSAQLRLVREGQTDGDPVRLLALALVHLQNITPAELAQLDAAQTELARGALAQIETRLRALSRGLRGG